MTSLMTQAYNKNIPKIPIQLFQINIVTSVVSKHLCFLFESLEAKFSDRFCQQISYILCRDLNRALKKTVASGNPLHLP